MDTKISVNQYVRRFAERMQIELNNNSYNKTSIFDWEGIEEKIVDLEYHKAKMMIALRCGEFVAMKEYVADCGNILMSIGYELGFYNSDETESEFAAQLSKEVFNYVDPKEQKAGSLTENIK